MKRPVIVMRIVVAQASDVDELGRQFEVGGVDRDFELRPGIESGLTSEHQLAIGQARFGKSGVARMSGVNARDGLRVAGNTGFQD